MSQTTFNTRIINKHDTLANWNTSSCILKDGEIALAYIPTTDTGNSNVTKPTYLIKVGDGTHTFSELNWVNAPAADVYAWAKLENPTIAQLPTNLKTAITDLQTKVGDTNVSSAISAAIGALDVTDTAVANQFVTAVSETDGSITVTRRALSADDIPALAISKITGLQTALDAKVDESDFTTFQTTNSAAISAAQSAADDAQSAVDTLEAKVGTVPSDKTIVGMISEAQTAATYDDSDVVTLVGNDVDSSTGKANLSVREIAADEAATAVAGVVNNAPAAFDTLKEIADWISTAGNNGATAADMVTAINALEAIVAGIGGSGQSATVVAYVTSAINALNIGNYALAADLTTLAGRVSDLEGDTHTHSNKSLLDTYTQTETDLADAVSKKHNHSNKSVLDGITAEKVAAWDAAPDASNLADIATSGNIDDLVQTASTYVIFDCGTSSVNI